MRKKINKIYFGLIYITMLYNTPTGASYVIVQYIIVELDGTKFIPSETFKERYFEEEEDAYNAISNLGSVSVRYVVLPTSIIFKPNT